MHSKNGQKNWANLYVADLETVNKDPTYTWAVGVCNIGTLEFTWMKTIDELFAFMKNHPKKYYFHNLKFDGGFIVDYLLKHDFVHVDSYTVNEETGKAKRRKLSPGEFTTCISKEGAWYNICFNAAGTNIEILDSLKIIPLAIENIPGAFGLELSKGTIDYNKERPIGYEPDTNEIEYLKHDCVIAAKALARMFEMGLDKMTIASNAMGYFKLIFGSTTFDHFFPVLDRGVDKEIRKAYRGGFTWCNPDIKGKDLGPGCVYDKNSMYPWVLLEKSLPYGEPKTFEGRYTYDHRYPLYVQHLQCKFKIKEGYIPTIQIKNAHSGFMPTKYLYTSETVEGSGEFQVVDLWLTNLDLELFFLHYEMVEPPTFLGGYKFKSSVLLFKEYVSYWYSKKETATREGNKGMRTIAKLMLNSFYGKFGARGEAVNKIPMLSDDGTRVIYHNGPETEAELKYIPVAVFVTAYARFDIITEAQKLPGRILYCDTDSLHLIGLEAPEGLDIDPYRIGAWDRESEFTRARFLNAKRYIEEINGKLQVKCAGMPSKIHDQVTWENFHVGKIFDGKLTHHTVEGGVILTPTTFEIKEI